MTVLSYAKQSIDEADIDAIVEVLRSDRLTQGPLVADFEASLCRQFSAKHSCVVANGTAALHLTALALGWKPGDIIITSPISFLASSNCILYAGAHPDFVDIHPDTYTIDPSKLEARVKDHRKFGRRVRAIIAVDFAGHPSDWKALRQIADRYDIQLVNDNSHALGAVYMGDPHYAAKYADVVTLSFHPVKQITTGEGGAVVTNDATIHGKVQLLRTHGITKDSDLMSRNDGSWYYEMIDLGFNYRITDFQCALGLSQLKKLKEFISRRRQIASWYRDELLDNYLVVPAESKEVQHAYHLFPLLIDFHNVGITREQLFVEMKRKGIDLQVHYIPIHLQPYYEKKYHTKLGNFPIAEHFYSREVSLPMYPGLSDGDVSRVVESIKQSTGGFS